MKVNIFNQMCCIMRRTLNNKTRNETQIKFYKAMAVLTLTCGSETWTITKENKKENLKLQK
jgi:hypothetical protein